MFIRFKPIRLCVLVFLCLFECCFYVVVLPSGS